MDVCRRTEPVTTAVRVRPAGGRRTMYRVHILASHRLCSPFSVVAASFVASSDGYTTSVCNRQGFTNTKPTISTQSCIRPVSLNRVPALIGCSYRSGEAFANCCLLLLTYFTRMKSVHPSVCLSVCNVGRFDVLATWTRKPTRIS